MNYLDCYRDDIDVQAILALKEEREKILDRPFANLLRSKLEALPARPAKHLVLNRERVTIGAKAELLPDEQNALNEMLVSLIPWRKGPFRIFGTDIDAEWRSDLKWDRVMERGKPALRGRRILDIGANNLYYLYRVAAESPEFALGIDPMPQYHFHSCLQKRFAPALPLDFEMFGVDDLAPFDGFFDTVFCMGILYHRRNPMQTLESIARVLKPGGEMILEGVTIAGKGSYCLFPEDRYMKAKGYWFLPTSEALMNMVRRSRFRDVSLFFEHKLEPTEQRRTRWAIYESLEHFLDPADPSLTVEGHPAPYRAYIKAKRR